MPFLHGKATTVMLGSVNLSGYLDSMDLAVDTDRADTSVFGTSWKSSLTGMTSGKIDYSGLYDPLEASLPTLFFSMLPAPLTYCPGGGATKGDAARLASALDTSYAESSPVGGAVAVKGSMDTDGKVGFGNVLCPHSVVTGTTNGGDQDDLASTSTGWTAHLHVTALTGSGTWTVKIQDAATTDWADITPAITFTATSVATSQRLMSATATATVRRHVRYVATVAGGTGPTITMFVAFSRN